MVKAEELHEGMRVLVTVDWRWGVISTIYEEDGETHVWVRYDADEYEWYEALFFGLEEPAAEREVTPDDLIPTGLPTSR